MITVIIPVVAALAGVAIGAVAMNSYLKSSSNAEAARILKEAEEKAEAEVAVEDERQAIAESGESRPS